MKCRCGKFMKLCFFGFWSCECGNRVKQSKNDNDVCLAYSPYECGFDNICEDEKNKMSLNELAKEIHANAVDKGFYDKPPETGTSLMLIVSELGEAMEADRKGLHTLDSIEFFEKELKTKTLPYSESFEYHLKDKFEDELADSIIRILDFCAYKDIDIDYHIKSKMKYNSMRQRLHGKKY